VKRLVTVVTLIILFVGLVLFGLGDTHIAIAAASIPNNETIGSVTETSNSSASATITITMTGILSE